MASDATADLDHIDAALAAVQLLTVSGSLPRARSRRRPSRGGAARSPRPTRAHIAHASLIETLRTMSASVVEAAFVRLPLTPRQKTADAILADPTAAKMLAGAVQALLRAVEPGLRRLHGSSHSGPV